MFHNRTEFVSNPTDFPEVHDPRARLEEVQEPMVTASIIVPNGTYRAPPEEVRIETPSPQTTSEK